MAGRVYVGIAGWSYPDWKGIVYSSSKIDQLKYVSGFIDCVEINNTFYRPPSEKTTKSWLESIAEKPDFFFTAKLHRDFSHEGKVDSEMVKQFHKGLEPMLEADKLKSLLGQFKHKIGWHLIVLFVTSPCLANDMAIYCHGEPVFCHTSIDG